MQISYLQMQINVLYYDCKQNTAKTKLVIGGFENVRRNNALQKIQAAL